MSGWAITGLCGTGLAAWLHVGMDWSSVTDCQLSCYCRDATAGGCLRETFR